jgi:hypothetical protein
LRFLIKIFQNWEDDDLFGLNRLSDSVSKFNHKYDVIKCKEALLSVDNKITGISSNLFHSQSCFSYDFFMRTPFDLGSSGIDVSFESKARSHFYDPAPLYWYVYRWGNCHHLSGHPDQVNAWNLLADKENLNGDIVIHPKYHRNYWQEVYDFFIQTNDYEKANRWKSAYFRFITT